MLVTPNGWGGNFFNAYRRDSEQEQFSEMYKLPRLKWWGKHEWTLGAGLPQPDLRRQQPIPHRQPAAARRDR